MRRLLYLDNLKVCLTVTLRVHLHRTAVAVPRMWKWDNKFWKWCAAQAYGAYIVHLLLMLAFQHAIDSIWMGAFGKFMFIGIVITIASFGLTWLQRMIPGVKKVL